MKFCTYLCNDINFEPAAVQPCCNVHAVAVPRFQFTGGTLNMKSYAKHIQDVVVKLQTKDTLCQMCPELYSLDESQNNITARILFKTVSINMHRYLCNCKCTYCNYWQDNRKSYPILPVLQSLFEQDVLNKTCFFSWGGGESTLLPDFEETSRWIQHGGWLQYVHTNALRFSPAIISLLEHGSGSINISLDSASPDVYKNVKGVDGFKNVITHISQYRTVALNGSHVCLKYLIFEKNNSIGEIEKFFTLCQHLDISSVQFSLNFLELNNAGPSDKTLLAAAFFKHRAISLGLACTPFFIPMHLLLAIDNLQYKHFVARR